MYSNSTNCSFGMHAAADNVIKEVSCKNVFGHTSTAVAHKPYTGPGDFTISATNHPAGIHAMDFGFTVVKNRSCDFAHKLRQCEFILDMKSLTTVYVRGACGSLFGTWGGVHQINDVAHGGCKEQLDALNLSPTASCCVVV